MASTHLVILSDREALSWVVTEQRMAFPAGRSRLARTLLPGDEVLLYTTRGCFRSPTRDLGRVMGLATVSSPVRVLDEPVRFGDRTFTEGCKLDIRGLAPLRKGVALRDLVPQLRVFPNPAIWSVRMRRAALPLSPDDATLLRQELDPILRDYADVVEEYRWEPVPSV